MIKNKNVLRSCGGEKRMRLTGHAVPSACSATNSTFYIYVETKIYAM